MKTRSVISERSKKRTDRRFCGSHRGAFTIIAAILIGAIVITLAFSSAQLGVFQQNFRYEPAKETVTEITSDLNRALTHALSIASRNYSDSGRSDIPKAQTAGTDYISLWQRSAISSHSNLGLQMNIKTLGDGQNDVLFDLNWTSNPGYSKAQTTFKLGITNYGFSGWFGGDTILRKLSVDAQSFTSDIISDTTSFNFTVTDEKGKPVTGIAQEDIQVKMNSWDAGWQTTRVQKIQYLGVGKYRVVLADFFPLQNLEKEVTVVTPNDLIHVSASLLRPPPSQSTVQVQLDALDLTNTDPHRGSIKFGDITYSLPNSVTNITPPTIRRVEYTPQDSNHYFQYWQLEGGAKIVIGSPTNNPIYVEITGDTSITAYYSNNPANTTTSTTSNKTTTTTTTTKTTTLTTTLTTTNKTTSKVGTTTSTITNTTTATTTGTTTRTTTGTTTSTTTGTTTLTTTGTTISNNDKKTTTTTGITIATTTGVTTLTTTGTTTGITTGTTTLTTTGTTVLTTASTTVVTTTHTATTTTTGATVSTTTGTTTSLTTSTQVSTTTGTTTQTVTGTTTLTTTSTTALTTTGVMTTTTTGTTTLTTTGTTTSTTTGTTTLTTTGTTTQGNSNKTTTTTRTTLITTTGTTTLTTTGTTVSTTTNTMISTTTGTTTQTITSTTTLTTTSTMTQTTTGTTMTTTTGTTTITTTGTTTLTTTGTSTSTSTGTTTITGTITSTTTGTTIKTTETTITITTTITSTTTTTSTTPAVIFHSRESTIASQNLGYIIIRGSAYTLPNYATLPVGDYEISYVALQGYTFRSWEVNNWSAIQIDDSAGQTTTLHVVKDGGVVTAIYSPITDNGGGGANELHRKLYVNRKVGDLTFTLPEKDGFLPSYTSHGNERQAIDLYMTLPSDTQIRFDGPALLYLSVSQPKNAKNMTVTIEHRAEGDTTFHLVAQAAPVEVSRNGANDPILYVLFPDNPNDPVNSTWWGPGGEIHLRVEVTYDQAPYGVVNLYYGLPNASYKYVTTRTP